MTQQQLREKSIKFFDFVKNNETSKDGLYHIDYRTIERVLGSYANAIFLHIGKSDIATFMDDTKGLILESDGVDIALKSLLMKESA